MATHADTLVSVLRFDLAVALAEFYLVDVIEMAEITLAVAVVSASQAGAGAYWGLGASTLKFGMGVWLGDNI